MEHLYKLSGLWSWSSTHIQNLSKHKQGLSKGGYIPQTRRREKYMRRSCERYLVMRLDFQQQRRNHTDRLLSADISLRNKEESDYQRNKAFTKHNTTQVSWYKTRGQKGDLWGLIFVLKIWSMPSSTKRQVALDTMLLPPCFTTGMCNEQGWLLSNITSLYIYMHQYFTFIPNMIIQSSRAATND